MELRHLRYFLALAEELSFVKAAEKLCISQPPLSRQIKELEIELNARLFNRNNKRVELTEAGKYFEKEVRQLLQSLDRITLKTQRISNNLNGDFRIGYISSTFSGDIAKLIKFLSKKYPYVNFRLYEIPTAKQIKALEEGKIELGIIRGSVKSQSIKTNLWFSDSFSVVFNKKNTDLKSEKDMEQLRDETFVFFNKQYAPQYYDSLIEICANYGFSPQVVHESNNISSIIQLVKNGLGTSIVPTNVIKSYSDPELGFIELRNNSFSTDVLLASSRDDDSEITKAAVSFLLR